VPYPPYGSDPGTASNVVDKYRELSVRYHALRFLHASRKATTNNPVAAVPPSYMSDRTAPDATSTDRGDILVETVCVLGYVLLAGVLLGTGRVTGVARVALAAPLLGFLSGYAVLSLLFPTRDPVMAAVTTTDRLRRGHLTWFERCSLAVATSLLLLPLVGVAVGTLLDGYPSTTTTGVLLALTGLAYLGGLSRRVALPDGTRYTPPVERWLTALRSGVGADTSRLDAALNVVLAVAVVVALSSVAFGLSAPQRQASYTETALLTDGDDGLVAGNYTRTLTRGESVNVTLTIENQEGAATDYTAVTVLDRVAAGSVVERTELARVSRTLPDGGTWHHPLNAAPETLGETLRLTVFVYEGDVPSTVSAATADETLFVWLTVRPPGDG